jgi:hypothetical protein
MGITKRAVSKRMKTKAEAEGTGEAGVVKGLRWTWRLSMGRTKCRGVWRAFELPFEIKRIMMVITRQGSIRDWRGQELNARAETGRFWKDEEE